jgi:hypothetical protein
MLSLLIAVSLAAFPFDPPGARKDHGPGTSGGGLNTRSAETLKPNAFSATMRLDFTGFERLSNDDIFELTNGVEGDHAHFDAVRWTMLETVELAFGAAEDFEVGMSFGYYRANDVREGHLHEDGSYGFHEFGDISGATDLWISAKGRVSRGPEGQFAVFGGVKLPTGDDDETDEGGTRNSTLEPSLQPGSGTFDLMAGVAYSRWLSEQLTIDASASYTWRSEEDDFKIGDLILVGVAAAYRLTDDAQAFPRVSVFAEAALRHLFENEEDGEEVSNSGGTVLFLGPGIRVGLSERFTWQLGVYFPVVQELNEPQQWTYYKVSTGITLSF